MNERAETITTLTEHLDHWKRLLSEGVCTKEEGEKTINALTFAIRALEVISHLKDRPCSACEFHKENGCCKWDCVFDEVIRK